MLWIELAGGIPPIIYTSKRCLRLVRAEHLIARYALPLKAGAMRAFIERPDDFKHSGVIMQRLQEMPSIPPLAWVQRQRLRKLVTRKIQQSIVEKLNDEQ